MNGRRMNTNFCEVVCQLSHVKSNSTLTHCSLNTNTVFLLNIGMEAIYPKLYLFCTSGTKWSPGSRTPAWSNRSSLSVLFSNMSVCSIQKLRTRIQMVYRQFSGLKTLEVCEHNSLAVKTQQCFQQWQPRLNLLHKFKKTLTLWWRMHVDRRTEIYRRFDLWPCDDMANRGQGFTPR
jgi:hypothetical protein